MGYWSPGVSKQLCHYKGSPSPMEVATQSPELLFSLLAPPTIMAAMGQEMVMAETQEADPVTSMFSLCLSSYITSHFRLCSHSRGLLILLQ